MDLADVTTPPLEPDLEHLRGPRVEAAIDDGARRFEGDDQLMVETREPDRCYSAVPRIAKEHDVPLLALTSPDDNLAAVFRYLTLGARGGTA